MVIRAPTARPTAPQYLGLRLSADEFLALDDDGFKYQLINGIVVMSPSATPLHHKSFSRSFSRSNFSWKAGPACSSRMSTCASAATWSIGRMLSITKTARPGVGKKRLTAVPDMIIEVISPGSEAMDLRTKLADYERFGVREYWVIDPEDVTAIVFRSLDGRFVESPKTADSITSGVLPGLVLDLAAVRSAVARSPLADRVSTPAT